MTDIQYIDSNGRLVDFCAAIGDAHFIAVDTEFIREKTYYPQLCLIQVCGHHQIACIDPLAVSEFAPLLDLFRQTSIIKVMHSASQDMEVLLHAFDCLPAPVYDTQAAASLTGLGENISYARLVENMLGVHLDKSHTRTDWARRPLGQAQIRYAADDVRYLAALYPMQRDMLAQQGRLAWLETDFADMARKERYCPDPKNAWKRVKGYARLRGHELAVLKYLAEYRENQAIKADRPRRFILKDDLVIDVARGKPVSIKDIAHRRGFEQVIKRHGKALVECVHKGLALPKDQWPEINKGTPLSDNQELLADVLMALLKQQSRLNNVSVNTLASRQEIERLARSQRDIPLLHGWRYELGGKVLVDFIDNHLGLVVDEQQLQLKPLP